MLPAAEIEQFRKILLAWFGAHRRDLAWRRTRDPYAIWVSEIMLQQTRVAAVIPYYERFLARFPTFHALAEAAETEVLAHWAGLGHYYRARNMHRAAKMMCETGAFPQTFEEIRRLPGIGDYTAAAVASIGFDLPHAVVDGNVFRVLSRVLGDATNIAAAGSRKHFTRLADALLDREQPGSFNQALMELGATICLASKPQCLVCPVSSVCRARRDGRQSELPVKIARKRTVRERRIVFWIERADELLLWQRSPASRLMPGFWELPERKQLPGAVAGRLLGSFRHSITFHNYVFDVCAAEAPQHCGECEWIRCDKLLELPASTILRKAERVVARTGNSRATARSAATSGS